MNVENICLSSKTIDISETKNYLELTNRVCFYDEPNLNGVRLLSDNAVDKANTLVNQPVVAKYKKNSKGLPTFGGHEVSVDSKGNVVFGTDNIGTHTEVYIANDNVDVKGEVKNLPCLFAKYRIWTRNLNVVAAVKRLFSEGKLYSSWEISSLAYTFENGIKTLTDYIFDSNCLLGYEYASPAYGVDAKGISLSAKDSQLMIAEAFSQDLLSDINLKDQKKEDEITLGKQKNTVVSEEVIDTTTTENQDIDPIESEVTEVITTEEVDTETSALTSYDLRNKICEACRSKINQYCYISYLFPNEKEVWVESDIRDSELDYLLFTYEVNNNVVTVSDPTKVKLTVNVSQVNSTIETLKAEIETKTNALIEAGTTIQSLNTSIAELNPFKEKFEQAEQERIQSETEAKKDTLRATALKTGLFTKDELEASEEIKGLIDSLNEKGLKEVIATRLIASLTKTDVQQTVETSSIKESVATASLVDGDVELDTKSIMKKYFGGR